MRIALSIAVDRDAINELVFDGLMTPRQYSPIEHLAPGLSQAGQCLHRVRSGCGQPLLDEAGYSEKNADGMRVWPGTDEAISFIIEGIDQPGSQMKTSSTRSLKYYAAVGVQATYKYVERSLYTEHYQANEIEAAWLGRRPHGRAAGRADHLDRRAAGSPVVPGLGR